MKVMSFMHAKLDVTDIERAEKFYRDLLGLREIVRHTSPNGVILQMSPTGLSPGVELWYEEPVEPAQRTNLHIAVQVDDTRGLIAHLRQHGVEVTREPFEIGDEIIAFIRDPDGYLIELNQTKSSDTP